MRSACASSLPLSPVRQPIALLDDISYKWESRLSQSIISFLSASDYHRIGIIFYATIANQRDSSSIGDIDMV